jgi:hypothetical protein
MVTMVRFLQSARPIVRFFLGVLFVASLSACSGVEDVVDVAVDPPERKPLDYSKVAVNNFFVNSQFGSIPEQWNDIRNNLGIKHVRILFAWTDGVQPTPRSPVAVDFYDNILAAVPPDADVMITVAHSPSWMQNSANWIDGDPRRTWVELWLRPLVRRYKGLRQVAGWQVWNEPNLTVLPGDALLGLEDPANYFKLLQMGSEVIREEDPGKLVIMAATTSINQNFPIALNYNRDLKNLGAEGLVDVWAVHYYGKNFESVVTGGGVADFLNGVSKALWVTESGEQGVNNQLAYVETVWPFLLEEIPGILRFYYYEYGSTQPANDAFGLRTTDPAFPVSDFYLNLSERN